MAQSITALQLDPCIAPWRKVEIRRRTQSGYEENWLDVTKYVTKWPTIDFKMDTVNPFDYRIGDAVINFRSDDKQFGNEAFTQSIFFGFFTRYKTMVRISTGLKDLDTDVAYPTSDAQVFYGLVEHITDGISECSFVVLSMMSLIKLLPASILSGFKGVNKTAKELIEGIRDTQDASLNYLLHPYISQTAWLLTCTAETYNIGTTTSLDNVSCFDFVGNLAKAENHTFYIDKSGNFIFRPRTAPTAVSYYFNGPGFSNVNIESLQEYNEGIMNTYTKITCELANNTTVVAQETYTLGDASASWKYGVREFSWGNPYTDAISAGVQSVRLLDELRTPKTELTIRTKYIAPNLDLNDRVVVKWSGELGGDGSLWDYFTWDVGLWSDEKGGVLIDSEEYKITGIAINMHDFYTTFNLKKI